MERNNYPLKLHFGEGLDDLLKEVYEGLDLKNHETQLRHFFEDTPVRHLFIEYFPGQFSFKIYEKHSSGKDLKSIIDLASKCLELSKYKGYPELVKGLGNPTQFSNTEFEIDCVYFCHVQTSVKNIIFGRELIVKGKRKIPDFIIETDMGEFVCECKSLGHNNRRDETTFKRVSSKVSDSIIDIIKRYPDLRIEVLVNEVAKGDPLKNINDLCVQVAQAASRGLLDEQHVHEFSFKLILKSDPKFYTDVHVAHSVGTVGTTPINLKDHTNHQVRVLRKYSGLVKHTERLMKEATNQIPSDMSGIIFIGATNLMATEEAAHKFISRRSFPNIKGVIFPIGKWKLVSGHDDVQTIKAALNLFR